MEQTSNEWVEKHFSTNNGKCEFNNPTKIVCINSKCTYDNPSMCRYDGCGCILSHPRCSSQPVEFISSQIKLQTKPTA